MMMVVCRGVRGTRGPPGTPGSDGVPGVPGNDGRAGLKGEKGDNVINTMAMLLLQKCCKHLRNCRIYAVEYRLSAVRPSHQDLSALFKSFPLTRRAGLDWASWAPGPPRPGDGAQRSHQDGLRLGLPAKFREIFTRSERSFQL